MARGFPHHLYKNIARKKQSQMPFFKASDSVIFLSLFVSFIAYFITIFNAEATAEIIENTAARIAPTASDFLMLSLSVASVVN